MNNVQCCVFLNEMQNELILLKDKKEKLFFSCYSFASLRCAFRCLAFIRLLFISLLEALQFVFAGSQAEFPPRGKLQMPAN